MRKQKPSVDMSLSLWHVLTSWRMMRCWKFRLNGGFILYLLDRNVKYLEHHSPIEMLRDDMSVHMSWPSGWQPIAAGGHIRTANWELL